MRVEDDAVTVFGSCPEGAKFGVFTFQYTPKGGDPDQASADLLQRINDDGRIYLTQTLHEGQYVIRFTAGQFDCTRDDVMTAYDVITELASGAIPLVSPVLRGRDPHRWGRS